jgi:hypothetical protein
MRKHVGHMVYRIRGFAVFSFPGYPTDGRIEGNAINPGSNGRLISKSRYRTPYLYAYLLKQVVLVHSRIAIGPNYFKDERLMLVDPLVKYISLFLKGHTDIVYNISSNKRPISYS